MNYSITQYLLLGLLTLIFVGTATGPFRKLALKIGAVDKPNMSRKIQKAPVPYLGGAAIALGTVLVSYSSLLTQDFSMKTFELASSVLIPAILISAMGLWDD